MRDDVLRGLILVQSFSIFPGNFHILSEEDCQKIKTRLNINEGENNWFQKE